MDNKFKVFVIIALVVLFTGMAAGGFYIVKKVSNGVPNQETSAAVSAKDIQVFSLTDPITTNLTSENKNSTKQHIIKVTVGFGINKKAKDFKEIAKELEEKEMLVRNEIIQALRDQSYENMTRPEAQDQLSEIIVSRISTLLATQSVEEIYFGDFFVQ